MPFATDFIDDLKALGRKGPRVLVVEDREEDGYLFGVMLSRLGVEAVVVPTADTAIELLKSPHDFKVVFLDLKLEGSRATWQDVAAATDTVPVVITTAYLDSGTLGAQWKHLTALRKPVEPDDVRSIFRKHNIWLPAGGEV